MRKRGPPLPPSASRFLGLPSGKDLEPLVRRFHRWLDANHMALTALRASDVDRFVERPFRKLVSPRTAQGYKRGLIRYLDWQHGRGMILFDPRGLAIRRRRPLPSLALAFVRSLEPTLRSSTCTNYRRAIHDFHEWLDDAHLRLKRLDRPHLEQWFQAQHDRGLHPATRIQRTHNIRTYLRWLHDRLELKRDPDQLIRRGDLPKLPSYLPRPLPPDVDLKLQRGLEASDNPLSQGLLLMRHTGLRVGELLALNYQCTRVDSMGNHFLEVPLGKLNNERLVPLSEKTTGVVAKLQRAGSPPRVHLLERAPGSKATYEDIRRALGEICDKLGLDKPLTTHQMRHTYATALLNGGMSLVGVMKLLGHRDYRMTLRYAAITQETVGREYFEALDRSQSKYGIDTSAIEDSRQGTNPVSTLKEVVAWTKKHLAHEDATRRLSLSLLKRIRRIQADIQTAIDRPGV